MMTTELCKMVLPPPKTPPVGGEREKDPGGGGGIRSGNRVSPLSSPPRSTDRDGTAASSQVSLRSLICLFLILCPANSDCFIVIYISVADNHRQPHSGTSNIQLGLYSLFSSFVYRYYTAPAALHCMSIRLPLTRFARASRWISTEASTTRSIPSIRSFVRPQQSYFLTPPSSRLFTTTSFRLSTMSSGQPETVTLPVLEASELPDGSMKQVEFKISDDKKGKVLLSKIKGVLYATSANCTHYGAPLAKGVLDTATGRVVCPWHGACFSVCSGDIEDAPGLDALWTYDAKLSDDGKMILVTADVNQITSKVGRSPLVRGKAKNANSTIKKAEKGTAAKDQTVVIIGGGSGGLHTIESLREHEYEGKIVLISKEPHPPIDRCVLFLLSNFLYFLFSSPAFAGRLLYSFFSFSACSFN